MDAQAVRLKKLLLIVTMIAAYAMLFVEESGVGTVLIKIQQNLSLSNNYTHWVVNSYLLTLAIFLLLAGKLSDIYGPRRIFITGIIVFIVALCGCSFAYNGLSLIISRLILGLGAALFMPAIVVLLNRGFAEQEFGRAFGVVLTFGNIFYAIGPFISGLITEYLSWRWFFMINIPIGVICLVFTYFFVTPDVIAKTRSFIDIKGFVTFAITIMAIVVGFMQNEVWSKTELAWTFIIATLSLLVFISIQFKAKEPFLEIRLFANKIFMAGNVILFFSSICLSSMVFWAIWLQKSIGFSPAVVGLALLPASLQFIFVPTFGGIWGDRSGYRAPMLLGGCLMFLGFCWIAFTAGMQDYYWILPGFVLFGFGLPFILPGSCVVIMGAVPASERGIASGMFHTTRQFGLSFGFAIISAVITSYDNIFSNKFLKSSAALIYTRAFSFGMMLAGILALLAWIFTAICIKNSNKQGV